MIKYLTVQFKNRAIYTFLYLAEKYLDDHLIFSISVQYTTHPPKIGHLIYRLTVRTKLSSRRRKEDERNQTKYHTHTHIYSSEARGRRNWRGDWLEVVKGELEVGEGLVGRGGRKGESQSIDPPVSVFPSSFSYSLLNFLFSLLKPTHPNSLPLFLSLSVSSPLSLSLYLSLSVHAQTKIFLPCLHMYNQRYLIGVYNPI